MDMERRQRVIVLVLLVVAAAGVLVGQAATAGESPPSGGENVYPGHTMISVQAYGWFDNDNGNVIIVNPAGEVVWQYPERDPSNAWVFDAEMLRNGNVLVSMGESGRAPGVDCPDKYGGGSGKGACIHNRVVEVDFETKEVVWNYSWYDAYPTHHEVHDADRLPNGQTVVADMGNHRAFAVNESGMVTWEWRAADHISEDTEFWNEYVASLPEDRQDQFRRQGAESDWTHMNDIDRMSNGNYRLSIRNFDVIVEVDPETNEIRHVIGRPDAHEMMAEQHNPHPLERHGTTLVADSENDRIVELDVETGEIIWRYDGTGSGDLLRWPRDADRLPNGNTLITDSRNFRVLEVDPEGSVVWRHSLKDRPAIVYEADRVNLPNNSGYLPEEPQNVPPGHDLEGRTGAGGIAGVIATIESWAGFVLPFWMGLVEILAALVGVVALAGLAIEGVRAR